MHSPDVHSTSPAVFTAALVHEGEPILNEPSRRHLYRSTGMLIDELEDEYFRSRMGAYNSEAPALDWSQLPRFGDYLPPTHRGSYTHLTLRCFYVSLLSVFWKLAQPHPGTICSSTMEEFAMRAILLYADEQLEIDRSLADDDGYQLGYQLDDVLWTSLTGCSRTVTMSTCSSLPLMASKTT